MCRCGDRAPIEITRTGPCDCGTAKRSMALQPARVLLSGPVWSLPILRYERSADCEELT